MRTTPTGLADLARAYRELNPAAGECLPIAHLVGLDGAIVFSQHEASPIAPPQVAPNPEPADLRAPGPIGDTHGQINRTSEARPRPPTYVGTERIRPRPEGPQRNPVGRPITLTQVTPPASGDMPPYIADAEQLGFEPGTIRRLPLPQPLVPIAQLRSLIVDLIAAPVPGDPDIERLVRDIARGHLPRVLPRTDRKGAARRIHVLLDTADSMRLFQHDAGTLLSKLRQVAGPAIQSVAMTSGPPAESHSSFSRGDTLLILSDLSIGRRRARRAGIAAWRDYATRQHTHGMRVVALVPYHHTRWPGELKHWMRLVHWHRPGTAAIPATPEQLRRLARVLSLAAVIDPALLRLARTTLLPAADAGAEADFATARWTSFFNPRVVGLLPAWTVGLRLELARDPELLELARRLLVGQRPQSGDWERVVYEEQIVFLALQTNGESARDLEHALARVIRSLLGRLRDDNGSARWALCFIEELPDAARESEAAQLLKAVASRMLSTSFDEMKRIVTKYDAKWVFDESTEVGVLWDGAHVIVREPAHVSDRVLLVPDTSPRVVIVEGVENDRKRVLRFLRNGYPAWIFARPPRRLTTAAGAEYVVESLPGQWEVLQHLFRSNEPVSTVVSGVVPARGYRVDIGLEALLPERELLLAYPGRTDFVGTRVSVRIVDMNEKWREITVGLVVDGAPELPEETWRELSAHFRTFEPVRGTIRQAGVTAFVVDLLGGAFVVPYSELSYDERGPLSRGEMNQHELDFMIAAMNADSKEVTLTRNFEMFDSWKKLLEVQQNSEMLRGTVLEVVRGGFRVDIGFPMLPLPFVPRQLMGLLPEDFRDLFGRDYEFWIKTLNWADRWNVILTRKFAGPVDEERFAAATAGMKVGDTCRGTVLQVADFGLTVAIGEAVGVVSTHEMFWGSDIRHPELSYKPGDVINVKVLQIDHEKGRLSLSWKALQSAEAFVQAAARHPVGSRLRGRVIGVDHHRAFVEIDEGIKGVIRASDMALVMVKPADVVRQGDEIDLRVTRINSKKRTIQLSLDLREDDRWNVMVRRHPVGSLLIALVIGVNKDSVLVVSDDGIRGMLPRAEIPGSADANLSDLFVIRQAVYVRVTRIDSEKHHIWFTMKDVPVFAEEWTAFTQRYQPGAEVAGTVARISKKTIFVTLAPGVEGVLPWEDVGDPVETFGVAHGVRVKIVRIDLERRRIDLTVPSYRAI